MKYHTAQNDRWDQISMKFYGHSDYYREIIKANAYLPDDIKMTPLLPEGIELDIPDIDIISTSPEELPPWKR
jgi:phage tail protein X